MIVLLCDSIGQDMLTGSVYFMGHIVQAVYLSHSVWLWCFSILVGFCDVKEFVCKCGLVDNSVCSNVYKTSVSGYLLHSSDLFHVFSCTKKKFVLSFRCYLSGKQ